jgi:hypothetical protein
MTNTNGKLEDVMLAFHQFRRSVRELSLDDQDSENVTYHILALTSILAKQNARIHGRPKNLTARLVGDVRR